MSYRHHVFVSYCWHAAHPFGPRVLFRKWVAQFVRVLDEHLDAELPTPIAGSIFVDLQCKPGEDYREKIRDAYRRSTVLVAILDAQYFHSGWCQGEWNGFIQRASMSSGKPTLILPIKYGDGKHFIKEAHDRQPLDLSEYAILFDEQAVTGRFMDFQLAVRKVAMRIAEMGVASSPYDDDFPPLGDPEGPNSPPPIPQPGW